MVYAGASIEPQRLEGRLMLETLDRVLMTDPHDAVLTVAKNAVAPPSSAPHAEAPVLDLADLFADVVEIRDEPACSRALSGPLTVAEAEDVVASVVEFMRDEDDGLRGIYTVMGLRTR